MLSLKHPLKYHKGGSPTRTIKIVTCIPILIRHRSCNKYHNVAKIKQIYIIQSLPSNLVQKNKIGIFFDGVIATNNLFLFVF
jgi:hypothetical protein